MQMPDSDVAAAAVAFTHAARLYVAGQAGPEWVLNQVYLIVTRSACEDSVMDLPLGGLAACTASMMNGAPDGAGPTRNSPKSSAKRARSSFVLGPLRS